MLQINHLDIWLGDFALLFNLLDHIHHAFNITLGTTDDDRAKFRNELDLGVTDYTGSTILGGLKALLWRGRLCCLACCFLKYRVAKGRPGW